MVLLYILVIVVEYEEHWTVQSQPRKQIMDSFFEDPLFHGLTFPEGIVLDLYQAFEEIVG
jgi:hypothetical protein